MSHSSFPYNRSDYHQTTLRGKVSLHLTHKAQHRRRIKLHTSWSTSVKNELVTYSWNSGSWLTWPNYIFRNLFCVSPNPDSWRVLCSFFMVTKFHVTTCVDCLVSVTVLTISTLINVFLNSISPGRDVRIYMSFIYVNIIICIMHAICI